MSDDRVGELAKALEAGGYDAKPTPATTITIGAIDTSSWTEFGDFFDRPLSRSLNWEFEEDFNQISLPCGFISLVADTPEQATAALRQDLLKLRQSPAIIKAYLAKPSLIPLATPVLPGEPSDTTTHVDLRGPVPAKRQWAAFCFLHGFTVEEGGAYRPLDKWNLDRFLGSAVLEGQVGKRHE